MASTPAGELARIKVQHPVWSIRAARLDDGAVYIARRWLSDGRMEQLRAHSLTILEQSLWVWEKRRPDWHDRVPLYPR